MVTQLTVDRAPGARPVGFTSTDALLVLMVLVWGVNYIVLKAVIGPGDDGAPVITIMLPNED